MAKQTRHTPKESWLYCWVGVWLMDIAGFRDEAAIAGAYLSRNRPRGASLKAGVGRAVYSRLHPDLRRRIGRAD